MSFSAWMNEVRKAMVEETGGYDLLEDLPDQPWRDWYEDEVPPSEAAMDALEDAGWEVLS